LTHVLLLEWPTKPPLDLDQSLSWYMKMEPTLPCPPIEGIGIELDRQAASQIAATNLRFFSKLHLKERCVYCAAYDRDARRLKLEDGHAVRVEMINHVQRGLKS